MRTFRPSAVVAASLMPRMLEATVARLVERRHRDVGPVVRRIGVGQGVGHRALARYSLREQPHTTARRVPDEVLDHAAARSCRPPHDCRGAATRGRHSAALRAGLRSRTRRSAAEPSGAQRRSCPVDWKIERRVVRRREAAVEAEPAEAPSSPGLPRREARCRRRARSAGSTSASPPTRRRSPPGPRSFGSSGRSHR